MTVYQYIAENNPQGAVGIINSFGYEVLSTQDLGKSLAELVANEGEPALKKVMEFHPDKSVILEFFSTANANCGCEARNQMKRESFFSANGEDFRAMENQGSNSTNNNNNTLAHQTNVILLVSALFVATALIIKR